MKRTSLPARFQRLLTDIPYVTIATTCPDGTPWNTPVVGYFDDDLNLYWASWTESQHSVNIAYNDAVFAVMYDSSWPLGAGEALYFQMCAQVLTKPSQIEAAKAIYLDRYGEDDCPGVFDGTCPRRIYRATPEKIWSNTDGARGVHFVDVRQSIFEAR
jgi:Pyridoxamine 5'-phosphate oxidase